MQPAPDDILTREIPVPSPERIDLRDRHLHATYGPLLQNQIAALAMAQAHIEALTVSCQMQAEQIAALKAELGKVTQAPAPISDEIIAKMRKAG